MIEVVGIDESVVLLMAASPTGNATLANLYLAFEAQFITLIEVV